MNRYLTSGFLFLSACLFLNKCFSQGNADVNSILNKNQYVLTFSTDSIPNNVKQSFARLAIESSLANPGDQFNATDVVKGDLPTKRLLFAGQSLKFYFISYEQGGRGLHSRIIIFKLSGKKATPVWGGTFLGAAHNLVELRSIVSSNKVTRIPLKVHSW